MATRKNLSGYLSVMILLLAGCGAASWFKVIGSLLPLAAQIATQFYAYSNHGAIEPDDRALIQNYTSDAQNILETISNAVKSVETSGDVSTAQKVSALLKQLQNNSATLLAALHVKDANTVSFIEALVADAVDLAGLVPVSETPASAGTIAKASVVVQIQRSLPKAKSLEDIFQARLRSLPK